MGPFLNLFYMIEMNTFGARNDGIQAVDDFCLLL